MIFNTNVYEGDKIFKSETSIRVIDLNGNEIFVANGISDFSQFVLEEGQTFDIEQPIPEETLAKELANIKIDNMKKDLIITNALQNIASLKVEVMNLKGGNV